MRHRSTVLLSLSLAGTLWASLSFGQVRLGPEAAEKLAIEKPEPAYPAIAKLTKVQGTVKLDVTVSEAGSVTGAKYISGPPMLSGAAADAVKLRRYRPSLNGGKPTAFITTVEVSFSLGISDQELAKDRDLSDRYFKLDGECRNLSNQEAKWSEAQAACKNEVEVAEQFASGRELEKMGAFNNIGLLSLYQSRFQEAFDYFVRALDVAQSKLKENDADLSYVYRNLAMAKHGMRQFAPAREYYIKAETTLELARSTIGLEELKGRYATTLKQILGYHLLLAQQSGATEEAKEIEARIKALP